MDVAPLRDWVLVIGFVISCPVSVIGGAHLINFVCCINWCRIQWTRLARFIVWVALNWPTDSDRDWIVPPIPPMRTRRDDPRETA